MSPDVHIINVAIQRLPDEDESALPAVERGLEVRRCTRLSLLTSRYVVPVCSNSSSRREISNIVIPVAGGMRIGGRNMYCHME